MLWVFSQVPISSQLGSGSAVFIPRMISSMTIANRKGWGISLYILRAKGGPPASSLSLPRRFESGDWSLLGQPYADLIGASIDLQAGAHLVSKVQAPMSAQRDVSRTSCCHEVAVTKERHSLKRAIDRQSPGVQGVPPPTRTDYW